MANINIRADDNRLPGTLLTATVIPGEAVISVLYISGTVVETVVTMLLNRKNKRRYII